MARVLVVDDAAFMRKVVSDALVAGGHEVVGEAGNGVEAVARFQELKPDLTMLDITMPEKTGLEALATVPGVLAGGAPLDPSGRRLGFTRQSAAGPEAARFDLTKVADPNIVGLSEDTVGKIARRRQVGKVENSVAGREGKQGIFVVA